MMKGLLEKKKYLRKIFFGLRLTLDDDDVRKKGSKISQMVLGLDVINNAKSVLVYFSINKEVETKGIIEGLIEAGKEIFVPVFLKKDYVISRFASWSDLEPGPFEILQPRKIEAANINQINVALVPGIVFSTKGYRLGYGKGVYDRLLSKSSTARIGIAYDFQIKDEIPIDVHDIKMDLIVSEKRILKIT